MFMPTAKVPYTMRKKPSINRQALPACVFCSWDSALPMVVSSVLLMSGLAMVLNIRMATNRNTPDLPTKPMWPAATRNNHHRNVSDNAACAAALHSRVLESSVVVNKDMHAGLVSSCTSALRIPDCCHVTLP